MRNSNGTGTNGLVYLLGEHLGSARMPTRYTYTGQHSYMDDPATYGVTEGFGLMFYRSRYYDFYPDNNPLSCSEAL